MKFLKKIEVTPLPPSKGNIIDSFNTTDDKHTNAPSLNAVEEKVTDINTALDLRLKRIANNQDFNNDLNQMPLNSYANYNAQTLNKPPANSFHSYGAVMKIPSASGYHLVLFGNDTIKGSDIAINSYINSAWTGWRYVGNDEPLIAPEFNQSTSYDVGSLVIKNKKLYICNIEYIGNSSVFDNCFTETNISTIVTPLKTREYNLTITNSNNKIFNLKVKKTGDVINIYGYGFTEESTQSWTNSGVLINQLRPNNTVYAVGFNEDSDSLLTTDYMKINTDGSVKIFLSRTTEKEKHCFNLTYIVK